MPNKRTGPDYLDQKSKSTPKKKKPDYKKLYPEAGRRSNEGQRQMNERVKHGDMHLHYGYADTPEGKSRYKKDKKEYGLR